MPRRREVFKFVAPVSAADAARELLRRDKHEADKLRTGGADPISKCHSVAVFNAWLKRVHAGCPEMPPKRPLTLAKTWLQEVRLELVRMHNESAGRRDPSEVRRPIERSRSPVPQRQPQQSNRQQGFEFHHFRVDRGGLNMQGNAQSQCHAKWSFLQRIHAATSSNSPISTAQALLAAAGVGFMPSLHEPLTSDIQKLIRDYRNSTADPRLRKACVLLYIRAANIKCKWSAMQTSSPSYPKSASSSSSMPTSSPARASASSVLTPASSATSSPSPSSPVKSEPLSSSSSSTSASTTPSPALRFFGEESDTSPKSSIDEAMRKLGISPAEQKSIVDEIVDGERRKYRVGAVRSMEFDKHYHSARYPNQENPQRFTEAYDLAEFDRCFQVPVKAAPDDVFSETNSTKLQAQIRDAGKGYALEVTRDGVRKVFTFPGVTASNKRRYYCRDLFLYKDRPKYGPHVFGQQWRISQEVTTNHDELPVFLADFQKTYKKGMLAALAAPHDANIPEHEFTTGLRTAYREAYAYEQLQRDRKNLRSVYNGNVFVPQWFEMNSGATRGSGRFVTLNSPGSAPEHLRFVKVKESRDRDVWRLAEREYITYDDLLVVTDRATGKRSLGGWVLSHEVPEYQTNELVAGEFDSDPTPVGMPLYERRVGEDGEAYGTPISNATVKKFVYETPCFGERVGGWTDPVQERDDAYIEHQHLEVQRSDDNYVTEHTSRVLKLAAGSTLLLGALVYYNVLDSGYAFVRPPGHHCNGKGPNGFCFSNTVGCLAAYLLSLGVKRIAILDIDLHQGEGTAAIVRELNKQGVKVMFISIHHWAKGFFPNAYERDTQGKVDEFTPEDGVFNMPLPVGFTPSEYQKCIDVALRQIAFFDPEILVVSAGFDMACDSVRGAKLQGNLTSPYVGMVMKQVLALMDGKRVVVVQEGGYNPEVVAKCAREVLIALLDPCAEVFGEESIAKLEAMCSSSIRQDVPRHLAHYARHNGVAHPVVSAWAREECTADCGFRFEAVSKQELNDFIKYFRGYMPTSEAPMDIRDVLAVSDAHHARHSLSIVDFESLSSAASLLVELWDLLAATEPRELVSLLEGAVCIDLRDVRREELFNVAKFALAMTLMRRVKVHEELLRAGSAGEDLLLRANTAFEERRALAFETCGSTRMAKPRAAKPSRRSVASKSSTQSASSKSSMHRASSKSVGKPRTTTCVQRDPKVVETSTATHLSRRCVSSKSSTQSASSKSVGEPRRVARAPRKIEDAPAPTSSSASNHSRIKAPTSSPAKRKVASVEQSPTPKRLKLRCESNSPPARSAEAAPMAIDRSVHPTQTRSDMRLQPVGRTHTPVLREAQNVPTRKHMLPSQSDGSHRPPKKRVRKKSAGLKSPAPSRAHHGSPSSPGQKKYSEQFATLDIDQLRNRMRSWADSLPVFDENDRSSSNMPAAAGGDVYSVGKWLAGNKTLPHPAKQSVRRRPAKQPVPAMQGTKSWPTAKSDSSSDSDSESSDEPLIPRSR